MTQKGIVIRHANGNDLEWLADIMTLAFAPFCSANQRVHASAILSNQLVGSSRRIGTFVAHQHVLVAVVDGHNAGVIQIFEEKHSIIKIGLLIVAEFYRGKGVTTALLGHVEHYAAENKIRQLCCNVPSPSVDELGWLYKKGFRLTVISKDSPAKGINEYLLYKQLTVNTKVDAQNVKVVPFVMDKHGSQAMTLIFNEMSGTFDSVNPYWINNLLNGKLHADSTDDEDVSHIIFVSIVDGRVTGLFGATLPKSGPIMLIPLVAEDIVSFEALLVFAQDSLIVYSHKLYVHLSPNVDQLICLQRHGWTVEGLLAGVYSPTSIVQQWAYQAKQPVVIKTMRIGRVYYDAIVAGTKTIEVRIVCSEIKNYKVDELIQFEVTSKPPVLGRIKDIRIYQDLQSVVNYEAWTKIIPEVNTRVEALRELRRMMPDSERQVEYYVIEFEVK